MLPYKEGRIQQFSNLYLKPLMHYRPEFYSRKDWVESLFGAFAEGLPPRTVTHCKALHPFKLKGRLWLSDGSKVYTQDYVKVDQGATVFVRMDHMLPEYKNRVDVEVIAGKNQRSMMFEVNLIQWNHIKGSIVLASDYEQFN